MATSLPSVGTTSLPSSSTSSSLPPLPNVGTISAPGVGSSLDVNSIITQLMQVESQPLTLMDSTEASYQAELSAYGTIQGAFSSVQTAAQTLGSLNASQFAATSSSSAIAASTSSTATAGAYSINVSQLAQAQKLVATGQASTTAAIGDGSSTTVTFSFGTISGGALANGTYTGATFTPNAARSPVSITVDATNNTLQGIRDAINASNAGVTASIINDGSGTPFRLALSVAGTGAANSLKIDVSGNAAVGSLLGYDPAGTQQFVQAQAAQNAALTVDGVPITSATNSVDGAIQGVTLTLGQPTGGPVSLTVGRDFSAADSAVSAFVKAYNDLNNAFATATAKGAVLQGDGSVIGVQENLRSILISPFGTNLLSSATLSSLGVTVQRDGSLQFDQTKLDAALTSDPTGTFGTLTKAGAAVTTLANNALGVDGLFQASTAGINRQIADLDARRTTFQSHLTEVEQRYREQFAALDAMISSMNQTSTFLQQQFYTLPNQNKTG